MTEYDELGQAYRELNMQEPLIHMPDDPPETVKYHLLTKQIRNLLEDQWEAEMRENFKEIENEVLNQFLREPDIADKWEDFRERWFRMEMRGMDAQCAYDDWLGEHGIEF